MSDDPLIGAPSDVRIDTSGNVRHDTDGFVRVVIAGGPQVIETITVKSNNPRVVFDTPPPELLEVFASGYARVARYVDIYESDNTTPWRLNVGVLDGSVTVDMNRDERRIIDVTLAGEDGVIEYGPGGLWYDKIIKPYRGITVGKVDMVTCLGEFMIDRVQRPHFPNRLSVAGRDFTKKLLLSKIPDTVSFSISTTPEFIIRNLLLNAGIAPNKIALPVTGKWLPATMTFDRLTSRWEIIKKIANSFGYEVFFDNFGTFIMREFVDPLTAPVSHRFETGARGSIVSFDLSADDSRLHNEVVVYGNGTNNKLVVGIATNNDPGSRTSVTALGTTRTMEFGSATVANKIDAEALAKRLLAVAALEQYDCSMNAIVAPWLEAGDAVEFLPPDHNDYDPTRFLLSNFTIPLSLGTMSSQLKRVQLIS